MGGGKTRTPTMAARRRGRDLVPARKRGGVGGGGAVSSPSTTKTAAATLLLLAAAARHGVDAGWIDPDTPEDKRTTKSLIDGTTYNLVMSDEFNVPNRSFTDGHDPVWTALDKSDDDFAASGGGSLHFYNSTMVTTTPEGRLRIASKIGETEWTRYSTPDKEWKTEKKHYKSGMIQSWEKFCFTGGIVEFDVVLPGDPYIGGLWPAVWMLGNLGRATYLASTNNIWPWSYDTCDRKKQDAQSISACDARNHYGLHPFMGRGATEIDIIEGQQGDSDGPLPGTDPEVALPYVDMTLQVAPGIKGNRPTSGKAVNWNGTTDKHGHAEFLADTWYEGLELGGNTSLNPFFYGTYMDVTKKGEPVTRNKKQAFQADAVGSLQAVVPTHFKKPHTFRLEWQPGKGGRLDWFTKGYRTGPEADMDGMTGDGNGQDWIKAYTIKDESIQSLMGSVIPNEPSYLIMNTAISSTWGFPYDTPEYCPKCYDCSNVTCSCAFNPGFCNMMKRGNVAMEIDHIRVYQSDNAEGAHVGSNHTLGCDPPDYPTREYIKGHEYRYMRNPPFSFEDDHPLKDRVQRGGGRCESDADCGGGSAAPASSTADKSSADESKDTAAQSDSDSAATSKRTLATQIVEEEGRGGTCVDGSVPPRGVFSRAPSHNVCLCRTNSTGPHCRAHTHVDESVSAYRLAREKSVWQGMENKLVLTPVLVTGVGVLGLGLVSAVLLHRGGRL